MAIIGDAQSIKPKSSCCAGESEAPVEPHFHRSEHGLLVKCYHNCKSTLKDISFWAGVTLSFPIEHFLWEKVPGFSHITHFLGL